MKRMGRKNRAFYRICATDRRSPRDGRVIEVLADTDARCTLNAERLHYWLGVGAKPSDAVRVLVKKYGPNGVRAKEMEQARAKLKLPRVVPDAGEPVFVPEPVAAPASAAAAVEAAAAPEQAAVETAAPVAEPAAESSTEATPE
jgi:small subunit ribosomal protein S16